MNQLFKVVVTIALLACTQLANAQQYSKITYVHSDPDGTPFAATDEQGSIEWQIDHFPFGKEYENTQVARKSDISFAGKPYDEEIGLSYFGGRWYDPDLGRFTSIDPMPVNPEDYRTYNRYAYGFNNPYKYVDPDGNLPFLIPIAIFIAKEIAAEAASRATGGATDFLSVRRLGQKGFKRGIQLLGSRGQKKLGGAARGTCCFVAGTLVLTESGYKDIEDIALGERLWAKDVETGEEAWKAVTKVWEEPDREVYDIRLLTDDGFEQKIEATDDHPFYVVGHGWKTTIQLKSGDHIESNLGKPLTVESVTPENRNSLTYNFTVADFHTYYVTKQNILVHNCDATKRRAQNTDDLTVPSEGAARRQAFRENNVSTSKANNFERVKVFGNNDNLKGPKGQPSEVIRTKDLNGNRVEIQHHSNGHSFPNGTHELPHLHGKKSNHISYPKGGG